MNISDMKLKVCYLFIYVKIDQCLLSFAFILRMHLCIHFTVVLNYTY